MKKTRLVLFGGTFDPPHIGHLHAVRACREHLTPDRVIVVPTGIPPHKRGGTVSGADRLEMTRLTFLNEPGYGEALTVSDMELQRQGRSYTVQTVLSLASPDTELFLLCGSDMFLTLHTWHEAERLLSLTRIALMMRMGDPQTEESIRAQTRFLTDHFGADIIRIASPHRELSSTDIRQRIRQGLSVGGLVAPAVEAYIKAHGFYSET